MRVQSGKELWIGPFAPINLETGSRVIVINNISNTLMHIYC